jgi:hypothetical protein
MSIGKYNKVRISKEEDAIVNKINENEGLSPEEKQVYIRDAKVNFYKKIQCSLRRSYLFRKTILIFLAAFITFQSFIIMYRNQVVTHFCRAFSATKFALDEQEEEIILLQFSIIQNKQDYLNILNTLQKIDHNKLQKMKEALFKKEQKPKKEIEDATSSGDIKDKIK